MRKSVKVVCASVLCAVMAFTGTVPFKNITTKPKTAISAADDYDGEFTYQNRRYHYRNNGSSEITLVYVLDQGGELSIPSSVTIDGKKKTVTKLEYPFGYGQKFTNVSIADSVKDIGGWVFWTAKMNRLKISSNLEHMGVCFCCDASVNEVSCLSKKIKSIEGQPFYSDKCPNKVIFGDWLIKWKLGDKDTTLDLTTSDLQGIKQVHKGSITFGENIKNVKIGKNASVLLNKDNYFEYCCRNIENVYINGYPVNCTSADNTVPKVIEDNYGFFDYGKFNIKYAKQKAEYVLKSLGLTYYGLGNNKKGTLSATTEYNVCKKIHDYIVKNYVYDRKPTGSYLKVFNCNLITQCAFDSEMFAFLAECAGVEADTICSHELIPITAKEKQELLKTDPSKVCPVGNYKFGKWGDHQWNIVTIGGNLYYLDTTTNRNNYMYCMYLYSDETTENGKLFGFKVNQNPLYMAYGNDKWSKLTYSFQNYSLSYTVPKCNKIHADLDGNYYCMDNDSTLLGAFICVGDTIKNKCLKSTNGYVSLTDKEYETINASVSGGKKIELAKKEANGKIKLLFNPQATDINFDGKVNVLDLIVINQRLGNPVTR